jgi:hypothetical protein
MERLDESVHLVYKLALVSRFVKLDVLYGLLAKPPPMISAIMSWLMKSAQSQLQLSVGSIIGCSS